MSLDLIFLILLVIAVIKGYQRGLIVGLFSFLAIFIGLAAAIKLSAIVAVYIGDSVKVSERWLPFLSFAVVFLVVILLVRLGANMIQKTVEWGMLGWANRLGGIILYVGGFIIAYSIVLFYAEQLKLLQPQAMEKSIAYPFIKSWGPKTIEALGTIIPFFKNMFTDLELFFENMANRVKN